MASSCVAGLVGPRLGYVPAGPVSGGGHDDDYVMDVHATISRENDASQIFKMTFSFYCCLSK